MSTPSPFYRAARHLVARALHVFYREIEVTGLHHVDPTKPTILASNHPNSIIDPLVLGILEQRHVAFCARDGLFRVPLFGTALRMAGAVPISRRQDHPGAADNASAFAACRTVLERRGSISLFPEGHTHAELRVDELRTGVARIALEAERAHGYTLGVEVVPVGLNFLVRQAFRSDVHVAFGPPLRPADYQDLDAVDPRAAARQLTDDLGQAMRLLAIHIAEDDDARLIAQATAIVSGIRAEQGLDQGGQSPSERTAMVQRIIHAWHWYREVNPNRFAELRRRMEAFTRERTALGMGGEHAALQHRSEKLWTPHRNLPERLAYAVLGAPIAAVGLLLGGPPYVLLRLLLATFRPDLVRLAWFKLLVGTVIFGTAATGWGVWIARMAGTGAALGFAALALPIGLFTLRYVTELRLHRIGLYAVLRQWRHGDRLTALRAERDALEQDLKEVRDHWIAVHGLPGEG
jgi:glycerol-3-phosphate O-acyltransferase/dihydroxyacetone phosphate acyltransferase